MHNLLFQHKGDWVCCQRPVKGRQARLNGENLAKVATLSGRSASQQWGCAMRLTILALLLSSGTAAFCQTPMPAPANPPESFLSPPGFSQHGRDFGKLPPGMHFSAVLPQKTIILPDAGVPRRGLDAQIDPKMIVHPPQSSLGEQPPGKLVAQNLYPGLRLLPIEESKARSQPLSTIWPHLKVQQIPITWPKCEITPVESGAKRHH